MSLDQERRRSRRSILAAAAGGAVGLAASRLAAPEVVAAANPPLILNQDNPATAMTTITGNGINMLKVVTGTQATAIWAVSGSGAAVFAQTDTGVGLSASATSGTAINATSSGGFAFDGSSGTGTGVRGWSSSGTGVLGRSSSGTGVLGHVGAGTPAVTSGVALVGSVSDKAQVGVRAFGRVQFPDRSGRVTIAAGKSYADVDLRARGGLSSSPLLFANLLSYRSGVYVAAVRPNYPTTGKLRVQLNKAVTRSSSVAWMVLG